MAARHAVLGSLDYLQIIVSKLPRNDLKSVARLLSVCKATAALAADIWPPYALAAPRELASGAAVYHALDGRLDPFAGYAFMRVELSVRFNAAPPPGRVELLQQYDGFGIKLQDGGLVAYRWGQQSDIPIATARPPVGRWTTYFRRLLSQ